MRLLSVYRAKNDNCAKNGNFLPILSTFALKSPQRALKSKLKNSLSVICNSKAWIVNVSLNLFLAAMSFAQESYNSCSQALEICANQNFTVNNIGANATVCTPCDDNFSFCFSPNNSIWLKFTTNATGGFVQVDVQNPNFVVEPGRDTEIQAVMIKANAPCDGTTYVQQGNCISNATASFTLSANLLANTTYYVVLSGAKNGAGINLAAEFTADVTVSGVGIDRPNSAIGMEYNFQYCKNEVANFVAHLANCPDSTTYNWYINNQLVAVTTDSTFHTTALKNGDIVSVSNSCYQLCPQLVQFDSPPLNVTEFLVDAGSDVQINYGEQINLNGNTAAPVYSWSPDIAISSTSILNPVVSPETTTTYFLSGTMNGCTITDDVKVTVGLTLEITNTFSPNDDGKNDTWEIPGLVNYPNCLVNIFDRWGQEVYVVSGYNEKKAWDGTRKGKALSEGTYYYSIELRDGSGDIVQGFVNLIR